MEATGTEATGWGGARGRCGKKEDGEGACGKGEGRGEGGHVGWWWWRRQIRKGGRG